MIEESKDEEYHLDKKTTPKETQDGFILAQAIMKKEKEKWEKEVQKI
jgi:hypothetical protein